MLWEGSDLPKPEVKVTTGDVSNTLQIKDSNIHIPNSVTTGLTNLGVGAEVAAGLKGGASIANKTALSPTAKLGLMVGGALVGGVMVTATNTANSIMDRKINSTSNSNTGVNNTKTNEGNNGPSAFSIEPEVDIDTVMSLLNSNYLLHICILYFIWAILILYISNKVVKNDWKLIFIKNLLGERVHSLVIKSFTYTSK